MKLYHLTLLFVVLSNGLLSLTAARLKCPSVSIANGSFKIRSKGRIIVYKCSRGFYLLGEAYAACIKGKWDSSPPVCIKPGCPSLTNFLNGDVHESWRSSLLKFTCDPGYKLIGPPYIYCNGRQWSAPQPHCQAVDIKCDFEKKTTCNWIIDDYDDEDFNWRLQQHEPPSRVLKTGPLHDHTLSPNTTGHYLVLETSDYIPASKPARIHSPVFPQPADNSSCFIFWYHMYGNTIGTLNVFLNNVLAFQRHGNHGDRWIKGVISLSENVTNKELQIIIEGSYGGGYTGDIGLDDFSISNGTDCLSSTVKSCVGRCYEDKNDHSSCLCNPECSVDASCCEDFMDVCSLESTTPFFEASTGVEDSSQVYSDTSGTTYYETSFTETPVSSTELEYTAGLEHSTDFENMDSVYTKTDEQFGKTELSNNNVSVFLSPSTNSNFDKDITKSHITINNVSNTEPYSLSTEYVPKERGTTKSTEATISVDRLSSTVSATAQKNVYTTAGTTLSPAKNITVKTFYDSTTMATSRHYDISFKTNSDQTATIATTDNLTKSLVYTRTTTAVPQVNKTSSYQTTTKANIDELTKSLDSATTTTLIPQRISTKTFYVNVPTDKNFIPSNKTKNDGITTHKPLSTKEPVLNKILTTSKKPFVTHQTTSFLTTKIFQTTPVPISTTTSTTTKYVSESLNPSLDETHLPTRTTSNKVTSVRSSTNATLKNLKQITPSLEKNRFYFNITTVSPLFYNVTALTSVQTRMTSSKLDDKKISNDSHTHLQTTSRLPHLFNITEEPSLFTTIITNTETMKYNNPKKWKSIYKPKDRFVFSAVQRDRGSENNTYVILSACAAVISVISAFLIFIFIRRRRLRFVNELEEADTDILYHSSQEMLDLHVARPNY